jgi:5-methylcytosine-specific restriction endonuclease McrA
MRDIHPRTLNRIIKDLRKAGREDRMGGFLRRDGLRVAIKSKADVAVAVIETVRRIERAKALQRKAAFRNTKKWTQLRYRILRERGARCECCGATAADGKRIDVDHIKPASKHPELALEPSNLQVLCGDCNSGKSNIDETDWRSPK